MEIREKLRMELEKAYPYKTELHAHTNPVSSCSDVPSEDAVKIYKDLGYTSLVVANHFMIDYLDKRAGSSDKEKIVEYYLNDYKKALEAGKKCGLNVILAAELRFANENNNDYLLYGIDESDLIDIFEYLDKTEKYFYDNYIDSSKLLFQAHPFRNGMVLMPFEDVDGYEALNFHPNHNSRPALASRYAKSVGKQFIIGTDFHEYTHEGLTAIRTKEPLLTSHDVVKALKENDFIMEIDSSILIP